jgi:hypothetical protein
MSPANSGAELTDLVLRNFKNRMAVFCAARLAAAGRLI